MKSISTKAAAMGLLAACCACHSTRIDLDDPGSRTDKYYDTPLWSVAISYPDGYDWMKDPLGGKVDSRILLFKDTELILQLDASQDGPICPEADMHRVIGGHLYSWFASENGTTLIYVDGTEKFSFEGRESVDDILVSGADIYTFGRSIESDSWAFRKNGEMLYGQDRGRALSGLYEDNGELCFAWAAPIKSTTGQTAWRYYTCFGGQRKQLVVSADVTTVHCIRRHNGLVSSLTSSSAISGVLWEDEQESICLDLSGGELYDASFLLIGGKLLARTIIKLNWFENTTWVEKYWTKDGLVASTSLIRRSCSIARDSPSLLFATCSENNKYNILLWKDGTEYCLPEKMFMISPYCLCGNEKYHFVGLNDGADPQNRPLLIYRGDTARFDFNGYFTELSLP